MPIKTSWNKLWRLRYSNQWRSLECHVWNKVKDFVILIAIFSILVEWKYYGRVGRPFVVALFRMVPLQNVLQQKKYLVTPDIFSGGWVVELNQERHFDVSRDKLGMDVAPKKLWKFKTEKQPPEVSCEKKSVPKNFANFTEKQLCWTLFLIKLQGWTLLRRTSAKDCVWKT